MELKLKKARIVLYLFGLLCLLPFPAFAQSLTTVSATITDSNGIPYSYASVSVQLIPIGGTATLNGQPFAGFIRSGTDVAGSFSMNLPSNAVILPGGTQWLFTVTETGIPAPLGNGPQQIVVPITISGANQNISATLNASAAKLTNFTGTIPANVATISSTQFAVPYISAAPAGLAGAAAPTTPNGVAFTLCSIPSGGTAQIPGWCWAGVAVNAQTGATYPVVASDRGGIVTGNNAGATAWTVPQAGSVNFSNNFNFGGCNIGAGLITVTPTTSTWNGSATGIIPNHWCAYAYSDPTNNYRVGTYADIAAYPNCPTGGLGFTQATGVFGCNSISATPTWDAIGSPVGNQALNMNNTHSTWTWGTAPGALQDLLTITDTATDGGTGTLVSFITQNNSSLSTGIYSHAIGNTSLLARFAGSGGGSQITDINNVANLLVREDTIQGAAALGQITTGASSTFDAIVVSAIAGATGKCFRSNNPGSTVTINFSVDCATGLTKMAGGEVITNLLVSGTAPTISAHFNTSGDSISANNGTAAFTVTVGTGAAGNTGTIGLPTATTGWNCLVTNKTRGAYIQNTSGTTSTAVLTNYGTTVGTPVNWTNSDVLGVSCFAY